MKTETALLHVIEAVSSIGKAVGGLAQQQGEVPAEVLIELRATVQALDGALQALGAPTLPQPMSRSKAH